jgi:hypothetical protein
MTLSTPILVFFAEESSHAEESSDVPKDECGDPYKQIDVLMDDVERKGRKHRCTQNVCSIQQNLVQHIKEHTR